MRRLKLLTAVLLMLALGLSLVILGVFVARADAAYERERVDELLERQVAAGSEAIRYGADGDMLVELGGQAHLAGGYPQLYVVEVGDTTGGQVVFTPSLPSWPDVDVDVVDIAEAAVQSEATTTATARGERESGDRERLRLHAVPVGPATAPPIAAVIGVANLGPGEESHARLVAFMSWSAAAVLLVGIVAAVLLSRGRWWVADQVLMRHEQFLRDTAHELRAPVTALRAVTETGLAGDEPPEKTLERVVQIVHGTDEVIADLMTLARLETGREALTADRLRLDLLVEALMARRTDKPAIRLDAHPTVVVGNAELVRSAVGNLLENAVRHGRADDPSAEITVTVRDGSVAVADRGPGVQPQLLTHLVERATGERRGLGGGLGLTIVGWVARVHGGELKATNRPDGGAVFTLDLPQKPPR